jgi:hypothetical protein
MERYGTKTDPTSISVYLLNYDWDKKQNKENDANYEKNKGKLFPKPIINVLYDQKDGKSR